jgi:hypothetical protein
MKKERSYIDIISLKIENRKISDIRKESEAQQSLILNRLTMQSKVLLRLLHLSPTNNIFKGTTFHKFLLAINEHCGKQ